VASLDHEVHSKVHVVLNVAQFADQQKKIS
jgi:hypothetical protein